MKKKKKTAQLIKETIDTYPGGICFAMMDGRPILVNRTLNWLIVQLTGHTVMDVLNLWKELSSGDSCNGCQKIVKNWDISPLDTENILGFELPNGEIWQIRRSLLEDKNCSYIQLEAVDVTDLYTKSNELMESNQKLRKLSQRQRNLLADIVQVNRERELLHVKMKIHGDLGRCIIATKKMLQHNLGPDKIKELIQAWEEAIRNLSNISQTQNKKQKYMETELLQVAQMIGCRIEITGQRPEEMHVQQLLFAAIREGLTNAVRHANANELYVSCQSSDCLWHIEITDNGTASVGSINESGGLGSLRKRLEQEGAVLQILQDQGVKLVIDIPVLPNEEGEVTDDTCAIGGGFQNYPGGTGKPDQSV